MDLGFDFSPVRSQKLLLIPQLKQAIEILEMNSRELFMYIESQVEANPALEEDATPGGTETSDGTAGFFAGDDAICESGADSADGMDDADMQTPGIQGAEYTLKDHLLIQLESACHDRLSYMIGEYLIENIDDNGYLKADTREVAEHLEVPEEMVVKVLGKIQQFDPPGICARDLRECLMLQLLQAGETDGDAITVVGSHLDALAADDAQHVAQVTGIPLEKVRSIFKKIKELEPKPGREFYTSRVENPVTADVTVRETGEGLQVAINEQAFPDVCISERYLSGKCAPCGGEAGELQEYLSSAAWLVKCLEQRENIILTVARKICEWEKEFFKFGPKAMKLLDKSSFAASVCLHESILDKAIKGKYIQCRWGVYELSRFFDGEK